MRGDHVVAHVLGVRARVADALEPVDGVERAQQPAEAMRSSTGRSRPQELTFWPSSVSSRTPSAASAVRLGHEVAPADGSARARARAGTMQYEQAELQPLRDLHPGLVRPLAAHRQVARELVEGREMAARQRAAGPDELAQPADVARAEGEVDERVQIEQLVLHRLRPAAADDDRLAGSRCFGARASIRWLHEAVVGLLADRAGVEDEHVGLAGRRRLPQSQRLQQPLDPLGVVDVHLAAERLTW